jgi:hypothetical protein
MKKQKKKYKEKIPHEEVKEIGKTKYEDEAIPIGKSKYEEDEEASEM